MKKGGCVVLAFIALAVLFSSGHDAAAVEQIVAVTNPAIGFAHIWNMSQFTKKHDIEVVIRRLPTYTQMQQAVELGAADIGSVGYQNLVLMAEAGGRPKAQAVAGIYLWGQDVVFHKDVKITKWKDIEGKKIARVPGSFTDFLFRAAALHNGVDLAKVQIKDFAFSPATLTLALKQKEVDALVIWVPTLALPVVEGFGYRPPISVNDTPVGDINGVLIVGSDLIQKKPDVALKLTQAYLESLEFYAKNPEEWVKKARAITGADEAVLRASLQYLTLHSNMYLERTRQLAKLAYSLKMVKKDTSDTIHEWLNYDFLTKATGKSRKDVGG